jgi:hypothetical protein
MNVFLGHYALFKEKILLKKSFYNRKAHLHMVNVIRVSLTMVASLATQKV